MQWCMLVIPTLGGWGDGITSLRLVLATKEGPVSKNKFKGASSTVEYLSNILEALVSIPSTLPQRKGRKKKGRKNRREGKGGKEERKERVRMSAIKILKQICFSCDLSICHSTLCHLSSFHVQKNNQFLTSFAIHLKSYNASFKWKYMNDSYCISCTKSVLNVNIWTILVL